MLHRPSAQPYVGLRPFERADSLYFFGRRGQVIELLERLHHHRFLGVVGGSGCGKSSLVGAGLVPALLGGFLVEGRDRWRIATVRPSDAPLWNLSSAVASIEGDAEDDDAARLFAEVTDRHLGGVVDYLSPRLGTRTHLLLLVDQFEEIFAFRGGSGDLPDARIDPAKRRELLRRRQEAFAFVDLLIQLARTAAPSVYVVVTMRTDFLGDCELFYELPEAINQGVYLVPRLTRDELREAVEGPALLVGAQLSQRLLDLVLNELGDRTDRLPILQHALFRTYERWVDVGATGPIDVSHYIAVGGLEDALAEHAADALAECEPTHAQRVFQSLTDTDVNRRHIRRPVPLGQLVEETGLGEPAVRQVLDTFGRDDRHFVVQRAGPTPRDQRVDISHESFIRQWDTLGTWVNDEATSRDQFQTLVENAREEAAGRASLLRGPELAQATAWERQARPTPSWAERYSREENDFDVAMSYLARGQTEAAKEERRRRNRLLTAVGTAVFSTLLTIAAGYFAFDARRQQERAETAETEAQDLETVARAEADRANLAAGRAAFAEGAAEDALTRAVDSETEAVAAAVLAAEQAEAAQAATQVADDANAALKVEVARAEAATVAAGQAVIRADVATTTALVAEQVAMEERERATLQAIENARLGRFALARPLAGRAVRIAQDDPELGALLARRAYLFNTDATEFVPEGADEVIAASDEHVDPLTAENHAVIFDALWTTLTGLRARVNGGDTGGVIIQAGDAVRAVEVSPDGRWLAVAGDEPGVRILDLEQEQELPTLSTDGALVRALAFDPTATILAAGGLDGVVRLWPVGSAGSPTFLPVHRGAVGALAFSHDSLATGSDLGEIAVFSLSGRDWIPAARVFDVRPGSVRALQFGPLGFDLAYGTDEIALGMVSVLAPMRSARVVDDRPGFGAVGYDPDGRRLASATAGGMVTLLGRGGDGALALPGHRAGVSDLTFVTGGSQLATASLDGTIRVWNVERGTEVEPVVLSDHDGWVWSVAFDPTRERLYSGGADGSVRSWPLDPGHLADGVCEVVTRDLTIDEWRLYVGDYEYRPTCVQPQ